MKRGARQELGVVASRWLVGGKVKAPERCEGPSLANTAMFLLIY